MLMNDYVTFLVSRYLHGDAITMEMMCCNFVASLDDLSRDLNEIYELASVLNRYASATIEVI